MYSPEYAKIKYEKINGKTLLRIAILSILVCLIFIGYILYKNYSILFGEENILYIRKDPNLLNLLPYSELGFSILVAITCFAILSIFTLLYKRFLLKKLPNDYFVKIQEEKQAEEKSNKQIFAKIHMLSIRKKNPLFFLIIGLTVSIITFFVFYLIYILGELNFSYIEIGVGISISILLGTITCFLLYVKNCSDLENLQWQVSVNTIEESTNIIKTQDEEPLSQIVNNKDIQIIKQNEDFLTNFFQTNHKYLITYNELTKKQADKSFWLAVFSSIIGAILIVLGVILMFAKETNPTYIATAGGVLTEIISTVFLYFHTNTIKNMSKYHNKLLLSQNISIALKVTETLPLDIQSTTRAKLAEQLVSNINKHISFEGE